MILYEKVIKCLEDNLTTYEVLKEIFENNNPTLWRMIMGAYLTTAKDTKNLLSMLKDSKKYDIFFLNKIL